MQSSFVDLLQDMGQDLLLFLLKLKLPLFHYLLNYYQQLLHLKYL